jgi:hypothetical protein
MPMTRAELEAWLCGDVMLVPGAAEIATLLHFPPYAVDARLGGAGFAVAVLRDAFPDDASVRRWLRAPRPEWAGHCALDLLWTDQVQAVEATAVRTWHERSGTTGADVPRAPMRERTADVRCVAPRWM